ncbi:MAG: polyphosphate kinase 2 family protein, partial [Pseudomonadota bacterium]
MSSGIQSPWRVPHRGNWSLSDMPTRVQDEKQNRKSLKKKLKGEVKRISALQEQLYAHDHFSLLCIFQAMDAAGKDSTIRAVFTGVNPAGFQVSSFKKPSDNELDHDFLWRSARMLPQRGRIGVFNRSYYEEVLVVRVHPQILKFQRLPPDSIDEDIWTHRLRSIADHERHLDDNGTQVVKFF